MAIKRAIIVNFRIEALHRWAECPLDDVSYLRDLHRHVFHIKAVKAVDHGDRDIEIIEYKRLLKDYFVKFFDLQYNCANLGNRSCEHIAQELLTYFGLVSCEVLEDGENGAKVWTTQV